jgi:hypothetical protein
MTGAISTGRSMQIAMSSILSFLNVFFRYHLFASFSLTQKRCFVTRFLSAQDPTVIVVSNTKPGERGKKPEVATCSRLWSIAHSISRPITMTMTLTALAAYCMSDLCSDLLMATMGARPRLARGLARRHT